MTAENAKMFATVEERTRRAKASKNNGENRLEKGKMREETKSKLQYKRKAESTFSLYACHLAGKQEEHKKHEIRKPDEAWGGARGIS